ncbi:MAG: hypothetical protein DI603_10785 [Roseateles depolymerans]|uniref:DUF4440 domain-containing protein n=1 Tax=Roseateles depolymerans TaxID=76731 RepID=A0A2W5FHW4_9BURK|nr:MAG: hypothetical protein DI603_10785 [Roseateles depolymerans]
MPTPEGLRRGLAGIACLLLMAISGCATRPGTLAASTPCVRGESRCVDELMLALEDWKDAYNSSDPRRLRRLYAPGALITDDDYTAVPLAAGDALTEFFEQMAKRPSARMRWIIGNLQFFGDTAVRSGECEFIEVADGQERARPARYSFGYQRIDGRWLIILQHLTQAP